jgi:hypothetical protein
MNCVIDMSEARKASKTGNLKRFWRRLACFGDKEKIVCENETIFFTLVFLKVLAVYCFHSLSLCKVAQLCP